MALTHIPIHTGKADQFEVGTSFPTSREDPMYIDGLDDGLNDGDMYYLSNHQAMGVRIGSSWLFIQFVTA